MEKNSEERRREEKSEKRGEESNRDERKKRKRERGVNKGQWRAGAKGGKRRRGPERRWRTRGVARDVAREEEVHWKWKVDLRTRPILTQSWFLRVRATAASVHAGRSRVCATPGIPTTRHLSSGPPAAGGIESANRQRKSRGGKKKEEKGRKLAGKKNRRICRRAGTEGWKVSREVSRTEREGWGGKIAGNSGTRFVCQPVPRLR